MKFVQYINLGFVLGALVPPTRAIAVDLDKRDAAGTATVSLSEPSGKPQNLASGFIYGFPSNPDGSANSDIPQRFIKDIGFNYCRAGGAQMSNSLGWVANQYEGRWKSTLSNYRTTRRYKARFTLLVHDLWGADSLQSNGFRYPGDDGKWKDFDKFLGQVIADIKLNGMTPGLDIDIWNEPDLDLFWKAPQPQYLAMWKRAYETIRKELPDVPITGPSTTTPPSLDNTWWNNYLKYIARTKTVPDVYSWHLLNPERNLRESKEQFEVLRKRYGLPEKPLNINEYAWVGNDEQSPAGAVFYISQLERHNAQGLRANWGSGPKLQDLMANLLIKNDDDYSPTGEWHVYSYYYKEMRGQRVATSPSDDEFFEVYATRGGTAGTVRVLASVRPVAGKKTYNLVIKGLHSVKITGKTVRVRTKRFDGPNRETSIQGPVDLGTFKHTIRNDQINFWITPDEVTQAYAFEFEL
ncbi:uncharacterized protein FMAN_15354 [Fusarium mangiferae]|uniref:Beta-xylosidase n=1 Tax=Fusarium mangiferae TaxID=192010 RepID=A0A1L7UDL2_FUSMA|nr:uncharacterized protein FMAN_15354 [Fusarium mangiferae]CVL07252.1 uncharacterized protein FMAN_15354 [Fusarium mangiferae]